MAINTKCNEAITYIRTNGYDKFIGIADGWKNQYGPYKKLSDIADRQHD